MPGTAAVRRLDSHWSFQPSPEGKSACRKCMTGDVNESTTKAGQPRRRDRGGRPPLFGMDGRHPFGSKALKPFNQTMELIRWMEGGSKEC